ncbi:MAG TPA: MgtC/SapB family protein [Pyrinomonadaceae bacterium]|nr:MgtC/SapB family protein [Pyrinomonadaceae bacterium]
MSDIEPALRLVLSALFGTLVGIERQWRHKNAGLKTNALVTIGATAFGLIALRGFGPGSQPTQIAAGVVTGIGFIGAGVVMHRGASVQGINSAATLWAAAGMGLALGQGYYELAAYILVVVLITQFSLQWASDYINKRSGLKTPGLGYHLSLGFDSSQTETVRQAWLDFVQKLGASVKSYSEKRTGPSETIIIDASFELPPAPGRDANTLAQGLRQVRGLSSIHCEESSPSQQD